MSEPQDPSIIHQATSLGTDHQRLAVIEERVKVDRKRFSQMLSDNSDIGCDADIFFKNVMKSTNTQIIWPPKLKPGTKSKKDPHVRITGSPNSIKSAKEIIFEQLDTRRNRVTLKMDVAFTDHSHIIGKGGRSIQRVMDESGCHIHFPDSNRTSMAEKSNQVSIAGSAIGVEQSRCKIREMLPITVQFDLPLNNGLHSPPTLDPQSPQLQTIQQSYGITIAFRFDGSKCTSNSYFASSGIITVAVRGTSSHVFGLRQGIAVLIEYLTGFNADAINVPLSMTIDVAVQHHPFIEGRSNANIRYIMQQTGTVIVMPDNPSGSGSCLSSASSSDALASQGSMTDLNTISAISSNHQARDCSSVYDILTTDDNSNDINTSFNNNDNNNNDNNNINQTFNVNNHSVQGSNRKTAILIKGPNFESVYNAWQELLGCLPLILIFDLREGQDLDPVQVTQLMEHMRQISILIKPKQRQNTKSIVVRGPERDSRLLFEVRKQILDLDDSEVPVCCSKHAFKTQPTCNKLLSMILPQSATRQQPMQNSSTALRPLSSSSLANDTDIQSSLVALSLSQSNQEVNNNSNSNNNNKNKNNNNNNLTNPSNNIINFGSLSLGKISMDASNLQRSKKLTQLNKQQQPNPALFQALLAQQLVNQKQQHHQQQLDQQQNTKLANQLMQQNYDAFKLRAVKTIINKPSLDKPRVPTPYWAGFGFSKSVSDPVVVKDKYDSFRDNPLFSQSNLLDEASRRVSYSSEVASSSKLHNTLSNEFGFKSLMPAISEAGSGHQAQQSGITIGKLFSDKNNNSTSENNDDNMNATSNFTANKSASSNENLLNLVEFLARVGLVQYVSIFTQHQIDLTTLLNLTENDLVDLGIPYIHRRKLAIAIAEMKSIHSDRLITFEVAPGAERSKRQKAKSIVEDELEDLWSM